MAMLSSGKGLSQRQQDTYAGGIVIRTRGIHLRIVVRAQDDPLGDLALLSSNYICCRAWNATSEDLHPNDCTRLPEQHKSRMGGDSNGWDVEIKIFDQPPARMQSGIDRNNSSGAPLIQDL